MPPIRSTLSSSPRWLRFAMVGSIGFVVDGSVLMLVFHVLSLGPVKGRVISFSCAVVVTWMLNRQFTFCRHLSGTRRSEFQRYLTVNVLGLAVNFGIYLALIALVPISARYPLLALVPSSLIAAVFNYWGSSRFAFYYRGDGIR